ncbi:hypothetical protein BDV37DRAFT_282405 [Aspergillus pseudonomiae]|uniref:Arrestin-like N-terminal domain-containing protein n=1 Tax=Aspergillus pseudonomiae TaxID=1506151 RepID=A0A5N7DF41_9EURO|nr:uncharacterized protein BDV37DRAFT_282405 [Aspergillus pseudonomiae]KAE8404874.1 hypothetical protein BDV37DRAFT_282405 [Aspergillus pseudonomiae]
MALQSRLRHTLNLLKSMSRPSPAVSIELDKHHHGLENTYTTFDRIQGTVLITVDSETPLESISITFEGTAKVSIGRATCTLSNTEATQTFLQLKQPVARGIDAVPKALQPGCAYKLPFTFVVPQYLPCQSCNHNISCPDFKQAHLQLPPTLDDPRLKHGKMPTLDYVSSGKCCISYRVRVVISKASIPGNKRPSWLVDCAKNVRVLPTAVHAPHLSLPTVSPHIHTQIKQTFSQRVAQPGFGELITEASSPLSLQYPLDNNGLHTAVRLNLRFNPLTDQAPPRLRKATAKLQVSTFYSLTPWEDYPSWADPGLANGWDRGAVTETFPLMAFSMGSLQWVKHHDMDGEHRIRELDEPSLSNYYTADIVLPILFPQRGIHIPTFHSCLISQTYSINLRFSFHTTGTTRQTITTTIKIPLQLQYAPNNHYTGLDYDAHPSDSTVMDAHPPPEYTASVRFA